MPLPFGSRKRLVSAICRSAKMGPACSFDAVRKDSWISESTRSSSTIFISQVDRQLITNTWNRLDEEAQHRALRHAFGQMMIKSCDIRRVFSADSAYDRLPDFDDCSMLRAHACRFRIFLNSTCELMHLYEDEKVLRLWRNIGARHINVKRFAWTKEMFQVFSGEIARAVSTELKWESEDSKVTCQEVWKMLIMIISTEMRHSLYRTQIKK